MDMDSVLEVLEIVARMMSDVVRSEHVERIRRVGAWAWALLGKCREVGQLTTEEVGVIRNLGKRATTILCKVQETETIRSQGTASSLSIAEGDAEGDDSKAQPTHDEGSMKQDEVPESAEAQDSNIHDASPEDVELEAAKTRLQASLQGDNNHVGTPLGTEEEYLANQIRALLDMTITVVGEFYGQRDLLEAREIWA
jgi:regulator of vacuolar morphogenesis